MAQATSSLALLLINELPPPPSLEQELAAVLDEPSKNGNAGPTKAKPARKPSRGRR